MNGRARGSLHVRTLRRWCKLRANVQVQSVFSFGTGLSATGLILSDPRGAGPVGTDLASAEFDSGAAGLEASIVPPGEALGGCDQRALRLGARSFMIATGSELVNT
jgi:hypothetical protein